MREPNASSRARARQKGHIEIGDSSRLRTRVAGRTMGQRRVHPRGALQYRASRAACREPCSGPTRHREADDRAIPRRSTEGRRIGSARSLSHHCKCGRRGSCYYTGRRVAARQLPSRRRADPRNSRRSATWLLSAVAEVDHRTFRRLSAGLRRGLGLCRSYGQPLRPRDAAPVRARLPARSAADDRRVMGGRDHAADRARGESSTRSQAYRDRPSRAPGSGRPGRPAPGRERAPGRADPLGLSAYEQAPLPGAFAVQLVQRLREQDPKVTRALMWLEERLAAQGTTADEIVRNEHQKEGATNVTVRNIITSMRLTSDVDWAELVESVSLVDDTLRSGSDFADMDFPTRNLYRSAIEELARDSKLTELEIARAALLAANDPEPQAKGDGVHRGKRDPNGRKRDPGYHLIGGGRRTFEATVGFRAPLRSWLGRFNAGIGIGGYIGSVIMIAAILLSLPLFALAETGITGLWLGLLAFLGLIPSTDAALALVNRSVTRGLGATILPGLELRNGVPSHLRTMVAVPVLLTTQAALEEQIERLEIHHLASPEDELHFALLSDWAKCSSSSGLARWWISRRSICS